MQWGSPEYSQPICGVATTRPVVIASNDSCNRYGTRNQIRSIDKRRLKARVSALTAEETARVEEALAITLGLPTSVSKDALSLTFSPGKRRHPAHLLSVYGLEEFADALTEDGVEEIGC